MSEARPYVEDWLAREPGMELARLFAPPAQRERFWLWGALLHQLDEAAFELSDAGISRTKLAWWGGELAAMAGGQARHPLVRALAAHETIVAVPARDWQALANAAIFASAGAHSCADIDALLAPGAPYARITARIEVRVFGEGAPAAPSQDQAGEPGDTFAAAAEATAVHHVLRRLEHSLGRDATQFPWPLNLRARHQAMPEDFGEWRTRPAARAVVKDLAVGLAGRLHASRGVNAFRRAQAALDVRRLRHLASGRAEALRAAGPATLFALWRAARRG